ncbi:response regulator [Paraglaciecola aestuariivivens]
MKNHKPLTVLMIEDNIDHAELMTDALYKFNPLNEVKHIDDGEEAVLFLNRQPPFDDASLHAQPDIILLDIRMPKQNGIATLKLIKSNPELQHIPVIMISTSKTKAEIEICYQLGANGYITKPVEFDRFYQKIADLNHYWANTTELPS